MSSRAHCTLTRLCAAIVLASSCSSNPTAAVRDGAADRAADTGAAGTGGGGGRDTGATGGGGGSDSDSGQAGDGPESPADAGASSSDVSLAPDHAGNVDVQVADSGGADRPVDALPPADASSTSPPNPVAIRILPGQTDLLGSFETGCTSGPGTERWCAVSRPRSLSTRELWLVDVTRAAAAGPAALLTTCNQPGLCIQASTNLYTAQPDVGPVYPEHVARASGNTFTYLADARSAPSDVFEGDVWVHTVGSASTTRIGNAVFDCAVTGQRFIGSGRQQIDKVVGVCATNPSSAPGDPVNFFSLTGGAVSGQAPAPQQPPSLPLAQILNGVLPTVQRVFPVHPSTSALRWRVGFTPDGETLLVSSGGAMESEVEKLVTYRTDDLGTGAPAVPFPGSDEVTRWTLSPDGKRIYYLQNYNYNAMGSQSGTLVTADFPAGTNARKLEGMLVPGGSSNGVGAYRVLVNDQGQEQGVGVLTRLSAGSGDYAIIRDVAGSLDDPQNVVSVAPGTRSLPLPSPDLRFSLFAREFAMESTTSDIWVVRNDGSNGCKMTGANRGGIFGVPFTRSGGLVFWTDNYDDLTSSADGLYTDPADCNNIAKRKTFAKNVDFWFIEGERLLLYSDQSSGAQVSLKYALIDGSTIGPPVTIQDGADRFYQIVLDTQTLGGPPARFKAIIYTLSGRSQETNGVYYYQLPAP